MAEAVTKIDKAGRVVIPKEIRERAHLGEDAALLVAEAEGGVVILKRLDIEELANRLRRELKGVDVESVAKRVEEQSDERAKRATKALRG